MAVETNELLLEWGLLGFLANSVAVAQKDAFIAAHFLSAPDISAVWNGDEWHVMSTVHGLTCLDRGL